MTINSSDACIAFAIRKPLKMTKTESFFARFGEKCTDLHWNCTERMKK